MKITPPTILMDAAIPYLADLIAPHCRLVTKAGSAITAEDAAEADALVVRTRTRCDEALLKGSCVRLIVTATIGFDHIDRTWCAANNIRVVTAAGCNARGVLQWVSAVLVGYLRTTNRTPQTTTLGIIGVGHVGGLVKQYAESWGFRVICCDPPRQVREGLKDFRTAEEVAREADILTLHTPLDSSTHHLVNDSLLQQMKPDALIINSSRGPVVNQGAILKANHPYAFDVWEEEPKITPELLRRALYATPHIAGYTAQGKANASAIAASELAREFSLPFAGWYPPSVTPPAPRPIGWEEVQNRIDSYCNLQAETETLRSHPERFEQLRDEYAYREEFF